MPARTPPAPGAVPALQIVVRGVPQHQIHRVFLEGRDLDAGTGDHVIDRATRQLAVIGIRAHAKQHMTIAGIGMATLDQRSDHVDHLADVIGCARLMIGALRPQSVHVGVIPADGLLGALAGQFFQRAGGTGLFARRRSRVDLVIHVGKIAHIGHMIRAIDVAQQPHQHIDHHHGTGIAQMRPVINRRTAKIEPHVLRVDGPENFFPAGFGIRQPDLDHDFPFAGVVRSP